MRGRLIRISIIGVIFVLSWVFSSFAALEYGEAYVSSTGTQEVLIVVSADIYVPILSSLNQYIMDLEAEDYRLTVVTLTSGSAEELKDYMKTIPDLQGAIFIGDLPIAEFEIENDFCQSEIGYAQFPIDLFYMDLDGEWLDQFTYIADQGFQDGANGIYDTHNPGSGDLAPEIWLGRLTASPLLYAQLDEAGLLCNYFSKNHAYRIGNIDRIRRALSYIDEQGVAFLGDCDLGQAYESVEVVTDEFTTNAADYKNRLLENYEWIHIWAHSTEEYHSFEVDGNPEYVYYYEIRDIGPRVHFYNLNACSNCRYTYSDYMGGHYVFAQTGGLMAIGSTKPGGMDTYDCFYSRLGPIERQNIGEAYKYWFNQISLDGCIRSAYYGMTLIGDPTLSLDPPIASIDSISPAEVNIGEVVTFAGSGSILDGDIIAYSWRSSIEGYLSGENSFSYSFLSPGSRTIYFKVQDDKGRWSSESQASLVVDGPDLTITDITFSDPEPKRHDSIDVIATVFNEGEVDVDSFTVDWRIDNEGREPTEVILPSDDPLSPGESMEVTYSWYIDGNVGWIDIEASIGSNTKTAKIFIDLDDNRRIDVADIMQVAARWSSRIDDGSGRYDPLYDIDNDQDIDIVDIMRVVSKWGQEE